MQELLDPKKMIYNKYQSEKIFKIKDAISSEFSDHQQTALEAQRRSYKID